MKTKENVSHDFALATGGKGQLTAQAGKQNYELDYDKNGMPRKSHPNMRVIIQCDEKLARIRYDCWSRQYSTSEPTFLVARPDGTTRETVIGDDECRRIAGYIGTEIGINIKPGELEDWLLYLVTTMEERTYHPIEEYIKGVPWDGVPRVDTLLVEYLGAEDNALTCAVTRKWLVGAVKRVMEPGCKFDYVLALSGKEGTGKSTLVETLGGQWYGAVNLAATEERIRSFLTSRWIVGLDELGSMSKRDAENVKAIITDTADVVRKAYRRNEKSYQRQCVFAATTNEEFFLRSLNGDRRWWVVDVPGEEGGVPGWIDRLRASVRQVWAEAYHYYLAGEPLYLTPEMEKEMRLRQETHHEATGSAPADIIVNHLNIPVPPNWCCLSLMQKRNYIETYTPTEARSERWRLQWGAEAAPRRRVTVADIKEEVGIIRGVQEVRMATSQKIGKWLTAIGWEKGRSRKERIYEKKNIDKNP